MKYVKAIATNWVVRILGNGFAVLISHNIADKGEVKIVVGVLAVFIVEAVIAVTRELLKKWHLNLGLLMPPGTLPEELAAEASNTGPLVKILQALTPPAELIEAAKRKDNSHE